MKTFILLLIMSLFISADQIKVNNQVDGKWHLLRAMTNNLGNPPQVMDRTMIFANGNSFLGFIKLPDGIRTYNQGDYYIMDDTTIVMIHRDPFNRPARYGNVYSFKINGDTLHIYGFFSRDIAIQPDYLIKIYINEWWVRVR